jgi:hypothetical protein
MKNFIKKLDKIDWSSYDEKTLRSSDGWAVSYYVKLQDIVGITESVFQIVVRLTYNDAYVSSYGCVTTEETNEFGMWFARMKGNMYNIEHANRSKVEKLGKAIFDSL